ncbi:MAG TPA: hypothetical protein VLT86_06180 [Vicinamibacterales bacterium]|nr:hypothetical protein [Vicinamibacterales bacterium]
MALLNQNAVRQPRVSTGKLIVTVADQRLRPITDLVASEVTVSLGGRVVQVQTLAPAKKPLAIVCLVDGVGATQLNSVRSAFQSAIATLRRSQPDALFGCVRETGDATAAALSRDTGGTIDFGPLPAPIPLSDAIAVAATGLNEKKSFRRVILAITSGPRILRTSLAATLDVLRPPAVQLWDIEISRTSTEPSVAGQGYSQSEMYETEQFLNQVVQASGGRRDTIFGSGALANRVGVYLEHLLSQYEITFALQDSDRGKEIEVTVSRTGAHVSAPQWFSD